MSSLKTFGGCNRLSPTHTPSCSGKSMEKDIVPCVCRCPINRLEATPIATGNKSSEHIM